MNIGICVWEELTIKVDCQEGVNSKMQYQK